MVLTVRAVWANWPCSARPSTPIGTASERSPLATASITRATSTWGLTRSSTSSSTARLDSAQSPRALPTKRRWPIRPSLPTLCASRCSSRAKRWFSPITSFKVSATFPARPVQVEGIRTEKSPSR